MSLNAVEKTEGIETRRRGLGRWDGTRDDGQNRQRRTRSSHARTEAVEGSSCRSQQAFLSSLPSQEGGSVTRRTSTREGSVATFGFVPKGRNPSRPRCVWTDEERTREEKTSYLEIPAKGKPTDSRTSIPARRRSIVPRIRCTSRRNSPCPTWMVRWRAISDSILWDCPIPKVRALSSPPSGWPIPRSSIAVSPCSVQRDASLQRLWARWG